MTYKLINRISYTITPCFIPNPVQSDKFQTTRIYDPELIKGKKHGKSRKKERKNGASQYTGTNWL